MKSHTSLVAQQTRLSEWTELVRDCQSRLQGMRNDEWCQLYDITKAGYYWRLRKIRETYLENADHTQTFSFLKTLLGVINKELYFYHVIQADETPMLANHGGRKAGSKSWMWVYRSGHLYQDRQIVLYEYQQTRNASHSREFLKGYDVIYVTDGYQIYHILEKSWKN